MRSVLKHVVWSDGAPPFHVPPSCCRDSSSHPWLCFLWSHYSLFNQTLPAEGTKWKFSVLISLFCLYSFLPLCSRDKSKIEPRGRYTWGPILLQTIHRATPVIHWKSWEVLMVASTAQISPPPSSVCLKVFPSTFLHNLEKPELPLTHLELLLVKTQVCHKTCVRALQKKCKKETRVGWSEKKQADKGK